MVKFQIMSDLHLETSDEHFPDVLSYITPSADFLILAGDIGRIHKRVQLEYFLKEVCKHFQLVFYVSGNHEYYKCHGYNLKTKEELYRDLEDIAKGIPNLHLLNRSSVVIDDVCIAGCTLWSQAVDVPHFIVRICDMNTEKYNHMFRTDLSYIEKMSEYCEKHNLKLLMITHHSPTYSVLKPKKSGDDKYKSLYASNLDFLLVREKVHTWVYGHTHENRDILTSGGTRVVSNQKGKPKDKTERFLKTKVITV